jgi:hypothetical protein
LLLATDLSNGVFGLLGVAAGSAVSWWTQREEREVKRRRDNDRLELEATTAWTLLGFELGNALNTLHDVRRRGEWPIGADRRWVDAWLQSRDALARHPPDQNGLKTVGEVCANLDELQSAINASGSEEDRALSPSDRLFLDRVQTELTKACDVLRVEARESLDPLGQHEIETLEEQERQDQAVPRNNRGGS